MADAYILPPPNVSNDGLKGHRKGNGRAQITGVRILGPGGDSVSGCMPQDKLRIELLFRTHTPIQRPNFLIDFESDGNTVLHVTGSPFSQSDSAMLGHSCVAVEFDPIGLVPGGYRLSIGVFTEDWQETLDYHWISYPFEINGPIAGNVDPMHVWEVAHASDLISYAGSSMRRFVLLMQARVGSTFLIEILASNPDIFAEYELLADLASGDWPTQEFCIRKFFDVPAIVPYSAKGFKTKISDINDLSGFASLMEQLKVSVIVLKRRNVLKQVISLINAEHLYEAQGTWNLFDAPRRPGPLVVDIEKMHRYLADFDAEYLEMDKLLGALNQPYIELYYEDLLTSREKTLDQVFSFLGVTRESVHPRIRKATSDNLADAVSNFDAVISSLAGTRYEHMLD